MSKAARQLRVMLAVERHDEGYFRGVMRGDRGPIAGAETGLTRMVEADLRQITGDPTITLPEFHKMCAEVRHQAALN